MIRTTPRNRLALRADSLRRRAQDGRRTLIRLRELAARAVAKYPRIYGNTVLLRGCALTLKP